MRSPQIGPWSYMRRLAQREPCATGPRSDLRAAPASSTIGLAGLGGEMEIAVDTVSRMLGRARRALMVAALLMAVPLSARAQRAAVSENPVADEEPLAEKVNDPLAYLTQVQIKDLYTPAEYGTNAQPNTVQLRAIFALRPFLFIPVEQLIRPTMKIVTVPNGKCASTTTTYDDMQLFDLFAMPWPNDRETHFRWGVGPYLIFPTSASDRVGNGSWQAGPALGFSYRGITGLNISALLQQATSFAYTSAKSAPVSTLTVQPILSYQLGHDWYVKSSDATWTINLRHKTST